MSADTVASIDLGTNSTRVLVGRPAVGGLETLYRRNTITRLGQGVAAAGELVDEAVQRTLACLRDYRGVMDDHGVTRVRMAATSAARDARNREAFFDAAEEVIGPGPSCCPGTRRAGCRSSAPPGSSTPTSGRS